MDSTPPPIPLEALVEDAAPPMAEDDPLADLETPTETPVPPSLLAAVDAVEPAQLAREGETLPTPFADDSDIPDVVEATEPAVDAAPSADPVASRAQADRVAHASAGGAAGSEPPPFDTVLFTPPPQAIDVKPFQDAKPNDDPDSEAAARQSPVFEDESDPSISPLAQALANMAEAQRGLVGRGVPAADEEEVLEPSDALEVEDGPFEPTAPAAAVAKASASHKPTPAAPPRRVPSGTPPPLPMKAAKPGGAAPEQGDAKGYSLPPLAALPVPEALAQRPRKPKRSKPWFEEVFDEDYLRTLPFMTAQQTLKEVEFIVESLEPPAQGHLLDVGCGYGRHAIELVQRGFNVTGLDLSLPLLMRASDEAKRRSLQVNFVHADMRELAFDQQFDAAYCLLTSFGYFDEDANARVAEGICRALKPGGRLLLDVVNRDYVIADLPARIWWEAVGCVVLEEVDFNFHTSRIVTRRSVVFEDGRQLEQEISVRAYSLHELGRVLRQAGFRVLDISGSIATRGNFLGSASRNLIVVAEKRSE